MVWKQQAAQASKINKEENINSSRRQSNYWWSTVQQWEQDKYRIRKTPDKESLNATVMGMETSIISLNALWILYRILVLVALLC